MRQLLLDQAEGDRDAARFLRFGTPPSHGWHMAKPLGVAGELTWFEAEGSRTAPRRPGWKRTFA